MDRYKTTFDYKDFPVGTKVIVVTRGVDFYFFEDHPRGTVTENRGGYLGLTVTFEEPRKYGDVLKERFNFHPYNLCPILPYITKGA